MNRKWISIFFIIAALPFVFATAEGKTTRRSRGRFEVNGYHIDASIHHADGKVVIKGWVSYGAPCALLRLQFTVVDENGMKKKIRTEVADVGGSGSRIIRVKAPVKKGKNTLSDDRQWEISEITAVCKK